METDRLKYFCAIVDTGSMTKAAEVLGVSHSGLSKAMSVLQDELGFKVFRPQGRGLELTEPGRELYSQSQEVLKLVNRFGSTPVELHKSFKLGLPEVLALALSGSIVKNLGFGTTIDEMDSGEIEVKILERKIDFGLTFVPFPQKNLDHLKLTKIQFSSFAKRGAFEKTSPEQIPYVVPSLEMKDNPLSIKVRDGWDAKKPRQTPYRTNSLAIALNMAQAGQCAVFIPTFLMQQMNSLTKIENQLVEISSPQRSAERTIFLVKRNDEDESSEMKKVAKIIRSLR